MRFVVVKSKGQQAALMLHKTRDLMVRQRTMLINALGGHLGEYGIIAAQGAAEVQGTLRAIHLEHDQLTDPRGDTWSPDEIREKIERRGTFRAHAFEYACALADVDYRLTKPKHWTNGRVEPMNRTIEDHG
jgi:transposase